MAKSTKNTPKKKGKMPARNRQQPCLDDTQCEPSYDYDDLGDSYGGHDSFGWQSYRSTAAVKDDAARQVAKLTQQGAKLYPIVASGRKLTKTFWGQAWCRNLEQYHDYESRLPRGRSYLRNGSVIDLRIEKGTIKAQVVGSSLYQVEIKLAPLEVEKWQKVVAKCSGNVASVLELLSGQLSKEVMAIITDLEDGLFPEPSEIKMSCSCLDWATMCKHVAASLYGVGTRLDDNPELFFILRDVDHHELIANSGAHLIRQIDVRSIEFDKKELESLFGIDISLD